jgi:hypothetical protein
MYESAVVCPVLSVGMKTSKSVAMRLVAMMFLFISISLTGYKYGLMALQRLLPDVMRAAKSQILLLKTNLLSTF